MATVDKESLGPNSYKSKAEAMKTMKASSPQTEVKGTPAKKSVGRQVKEAFVGEDAKESGSYFVDNVIVPAAKIAASDVVTAALDAVRAGFNLLLFGDTGTQLTSRKGRNIGGSARLGYKTGNVDYSGISSRGAIPTTPTPGRKAVYDAAKITFDTREKAEQVLAWLRELLDSYPESGVTVDDLYALAEMDNEGNYLLSEYGWYTLDSVPIVRKREGWLLSLPNPIKMDMR